MKQVPEYAKTDDNGNVIEYPVYEHHIRNRGQQPQSYEQVILVEPPEFNTVTHTLSKQTAQRNAEGNLEQVWQVDVKPLDMLREHMAAELAAIRWQHEIGGVTLPNGMQLDTSRESQAMTSSAYNSLKDGLIADTDWKGKSGWVVVTITELAPIAGAIAAHVRGSFGAERIVAEAIEQADQATLLAMNIKTDFLAAYTLKMEELNAV